jgi:hypothetical protein
MVHSNSALPRRMEKMTDQKILDQGPTSLIGALTVLCATVASRVVSIRVIVVTVCDDAADRFGRSK